MIIKIKSLAVTSLFCIGMAGSTFANASTADWEGFYFGGNLGQGHASSEVRTSTVDSPTGYFAASSVPAIATAGAGDLDPNGFTGGIGAGYNWQSGAGVFGLEMDWNSLSADDSRSATATYPCCAPTAFTVNQKVKANDLLTFRARAGYATNNSLFYVTAGWGQTRVRIDDSFSDTFANAAESFSVSKRKSAGVYGIGYEHSFQNTWSMKLEYLYGNFGNVSGTSTNLTTGLSTWPTSVFTHSADLKLNVFRIGFNYHF